MSRGRYAMGWLALAVVTPAAAFAAFAVARGAVGDSTVVDALSPAQVTSALSAATRGTAGPDQTAVPGPTRHSAGPTASTSPSTPRPTGPLPSTASHAPTPDPSGMTSTTHPSPAPTPSATSSPTTALLTSPGGSVVAQCSGTGGRTVYLVSWSPAQGFRVNGVQRGPGEEAEIEFQSDRQSYSVNVQCENGTPVQSVGSGTED